MPWQKLLRIAPFVILSVISLCVAAGPSAPRKAFSIDPNLSIDSLLDSIGKIEHWKATALVFLLAWLAVGNGRLLLAFGLTMIICVGWEIAEATAVGHTGRLSDLAPDFLAAVSILVLAVGVQRWVFSARRPRHRRDNLLKRGFQD